MHKLKVIFLALVLNACNPFFESQKEFDNRCAEFWPLEYDSQGNKVSIFWTYKFGVLKYVSPYAEKSFELGPLENKEIQEILDKLKRLEY